MKKMHLDAEQTAEALLEALGKELGESRADFCEALMDPDREDPPMFSDEGYWGIMDEYEVMDFESWKAAQAEKREADAEEEAFQEITVEKKGHRSGRKRRRLVLILVAVLILAMGMFAVVADGVKLKKSTLYMENDTGKSTRIVDIDKAEFEVDDFRVTYVPEGYELVEDVLHSDFVREICYKNGEKGIWIKISKTDQFGANVDNETSNRKEVLVNDKEAYLFDDGDAIFLVWQMGNCTIDVSGKFSEEELIQIASQIFVK